MDHILRLCVELDHIAEQTYSSMAAAATDPDLSRLFDRMAVDEHAHVTWWSDLLEAWGDGLVPDLADGSDVRERLTALREEIDDIVPTDLSGLSEDQMLNVAAHLEFYMLDPVFGELLDLMEPGSSTYHREAYARHVMRLVDAIEARHSQVDLARFLARVLARSFRDQQRLAQMASHDHLTGLYNRRGFYGYVHQWVSWAQRYGHPLGLVLVDVDRFKTVNDNWGHPVGDEALKSVARALETAVREADVIGRYGGDEFAILAPETGPEELERLMERVVECVREIPFSDYTGGHALTVSAGGAVVLDGAAVTPAQLLAAADRSLYHAKEAGRDRAGKPLDANRE